MRLRHRYLLAGLAWSLLIGPAAVMGVLGALLGAAWLWLYGDDPWPAAMDWLIPVIGVLVLLTVSAVCLVVADRLGRRLESRGLDPDPAERSRVTRATLVPLALIAVIALLSWARSLQDERSRQRDARLELELAELQSTRHVISAIDVTREGEADFATRVRVAGRHSGRYLLRWQVLAPPYGPVLSGERVVKRLGEGPGTLTFGIPLEALARSYVERALSGTGDVLVDEWFGLVVTLEPLAEDGHGAGTAIDLQDRERLRDRAETSFPVRFTVGRDGAIDY